MFLKSWIISANTTFKPLILFCETTWKQPNKSFLFYIWESLLGETCGSLKYACWYLFFLGKADQWESKDMHVQLTGDSTLAESVWMSVSWFFQRFLLFKGEFFFPTVFTLQYRDSWVNCCCELELYKKLNWLVIRFKHNQRIIPNNPKLHIIADFGRFNDRLKN